MPDYLPLLLRAIDGLEKNTGENRRALYERARSALVNQLRSTEPPLDESEITRERLALEESIRKVEAQAIKRALLDEVTPASPPEVRPSLRDQGLRNFRDKTADIDDESVIDASSVYHGHRRAPESSVASQSHADEDVTEPEYGLRSTYATSEETPQPNETRLSEPKNWPDETKYTRPPPARPAEDGDVNLHLRRGYGRSITIIVVVLLAGAAAFGYWRFGGISRITNLRGAPSPVVKLRPAQPATPKIVDRIGSSSADQAQKSATAPAATAAQKVVLYEEDANNAQGKRFVGSAIWRTESVSPGAGLAPELAVRAEVEIPEMHMRMTWSIQRDTDKSSHASHLIEVMFTLSANFPEGGVDNVPGALMKQSEEARGVPLAGTSVKVTNGYFLIGLSGADADKQRNIKLLKERGWFDIPIIYTSGKRAILALEKGTPGARVFEEAFRVWDQ